MSGEILMTIPLMVISWSMSGEWNGRTVSVQCQSVTLLIVSFPDSHALTFGVEHSHVLGFLHVECTHLV